MRVSLVRFSDGRVELTVWAEEFSAFQLKYGGGVRVLLGPEEAKALREALELLLADPTLQSLTRTVPRPC